MKKICYAVLSLAIGLAFSAMAYGQESRNLDDKATRAMLAFDDEHQQYILRKMGWTKDVSGLRLHNRFSIYV